MFIRYNLFTIAWAILILFLVLMPGEYMPETNIWDLVSFDKFAHLFVFAILTLLMIIGFKKQYTYRTLKEDSVKYSLLISIIYGISLEVLQYFSPGRQIEVFDLIANTLGCLTGYGLFILLYKQKGFGLK